MQIYVQQGNNKLGPFTIDDVNQRLRDGIITAGDLAWVEPWTAWQPVANLPGVALPPSSLPPAPAPLPPAPGAIPGGMPGYPQYSKPPGADKKIAAGICGILFGAFGIHKFILGYTGPGLIMLASSLVGAFLCFGLPTAVMSIIGIVEGIVYLTKSDEEFVNTYVINKKNWF